MYIDTCRYTDGVNASCVLRKVHLMMLMMMSGVARIGIGRETRLIPLHVGRHLKHLPHRYIYMYLYTYIIFSAFHRLFSYLHCNYCCVYSSYAYLSGWNILNERRDQIYLIEIALLYSVLPIEVNSAKICYIGVISLNCIRLSLKICDIVTPNLHILFERVTGYFLVLVFCSNSLSIWAQSFVYFFSKNYIYSQLGGRLFIFVGCCWAN